MFIFSHCVLMNNCIGLRNMRSFVSFLFTSYILALSLITRSIMVFWFALSYGYIEPLSTLQIMLIVGFLIATCPLYYLMLAQNSSFSTRWIAFFVCILLNIGSICTLIYPVNDFPQGICFGIISMLSMLWLVIGSIMIKRYLFLIQRGWTEKEKVARRRARRRY